MVFSSKILAATDSKHKPIKRILNIIDIIAAARQHYIGEKTGSKGGFPLIAEIARRQILQQKFGAQNHGREYRLTDFF